MTDWLDRIRHQVPQQHPGDSILHEADAAVLMAFIDQGDEPHLLLTRRADHMNSHAGEVAFPGGKRDSGDENLLATALRESHEEIQLLPSIVEVIGPLPPSLSKAGLKVVPFVGIIPSNICFVANEDEIDSIFTVPVSFFMEHPPVKYWEKQFFGVHYRIPYFHYQDYIIWGLTAYFITDSFNRMFDAGFELVMPKPVKK